MKVVIPSHGRADSMTSHNLFEEGATICIPRSQAMDYERVLEGSKHEILVHSDQIVGLIPKMNWLLDLHKDEPFFMLDDDCRSMRRMFLTIEDKMKTVQHRLIPEIIDRTGEVCEGLGAFFFGFATTELEAKTHDGLSPFSLTGFVTGCAKGFLPGHGLRYDERMTVKSDYDISALNALIHRIAFRNQRYAFSQQDTFVNPGGLSHFRNSDVEARDVAYLIRKWGSKTIQEAKVTKGHRQAYAGVKSIRLTLPF